MALYHTHRPQAFEAVIGQDHIIQTITSQIASDSVSHAYLFSGPRGVGKTTTARILAKAMNCTERKTGTALPCDSCNQCLAMQSGSAMDIIEIDAASHTGVDNVRQNIIENAQFKPSQAAYKVFIIDEVHMLSTSAFNALLKTLEEPPTHVIFILATTELHKLPATIISRTQRFAFHRVAQDIIVKHLAAIAKKEGVTVAEDVLARIAGKSDGCVRDAISLLEQVMATGEKKIDAQSAAFILPPTATEHVFSLLDALGKRIQSDGLAAIGNAFEEGIDMLHFADDCISFLRTHMVYAATQTLPSVDDVSQAWMKDHVDELNAHRSLLLLDLFLKRRSTIRTAPIPQLPLELLVLEWCDDSVSSSQPVTEQTADAPAEPVAKKTPVKAVTQAVVKKAAPLTKKIHAATHTPLEDDAVKDAWKGFVSQIESDAPTLSFILKTADIHAINGHTITLAVESAFHRSKLEEKECKKNLETVYGDIVGCPISLAVVIREKQDAPNAPNVQSIAAAFGGDVVS